MAKQNVVKHCLRLNMQNEQHQRIQRVLDSLDKEIHKSANQFIIKAVDFYIQSFDDDDIIEKPQKKKKPEYVTTEDLTEIRRDLEISMKDELIRLLGTAVMGGTAARVQESRERDIQEEAEEDRLYATKAANKWG